MAPPAVGGSWAQTTTATQRELGRWEHEQLEWVQRWQLRHLRQLQDATDVYWTDYGAGGGWGAVWKVPIGGGKTSTLYSGPTPQIIAVNGSSAYWTDFNDSSVVRAPLQGGAASTFASGQSAMYVALDGTSAYWGAAGQGGTSALVKMPLAGGAITTLATYQGAAYGVAVDATNVYWTDGNANVMKAPLTGGTPVTLASGLPLSPTAIVSDGLNVYWTTVGDMPQNDTEGSVMKVAVNGGTPLTLATGLTHEGIAVDDTSLYWTSSACPAPPGNCIGVVMKRTPK